MPTVATGAIIAASAAAGSSAAASAARQAQERRECEELMASFDSSAASVDDRREYAGCVKMLHPVESKPILSPEESAFHSELYDYALPIAIVFAAFLAWLAERSDYNPSFLGWFFWTLILGFMFAVAAYPATGIVAMIAR